ncbi:hypothetical protein LSH36_1030g00000 [Paralvinella palmiformis]|uniref:Uncharacterized protein n=1 Tax=Paralvinella palmiformis TaxID=53620 RepID=A0AAD9IWI9_9ANNE|nr:hypothetical protein LSH36_1030g00000 [Paralvinella palmiformis]
MSAIIRLIVVIVLSYEVAAVTDYMNFKLCYQENAYCMKKKIACPEGFVISVEWSRIAFSEYWAGDGTRSNCTPTSGTCYEEVDGPTINCSNSNSCQLDSCG